MDHRVDAQRTRRGFHHDCRRYDTIVGTDVCLDRTTSPTIIEESGDHRRWLQPVQRPHTGIAHVGDGQPGKQARHAHQTDAGYHRHGTRDHVEDTEGQNVLDTQLGHALRNLPGHL